MASKHRNQQSSQPIKTQITTKSKARAFKNDSAFQASDIIPLILVFLFLAVDFVPIMDSADVMGPQWVYIVIINVISAGYLFFDKKTSSLAITGVSKNLLTILYSGLFILAGISIFGALNKIESFVTYARFAATFFAFFNIAILLFNRGHLFKIIAQILAVFLLIQSISILSQFFKGLGDIKLDELIYSLKGNSGNKNIMAASLVIKIPFAAYCIYSFKTLGRVFNVIALVLGAMAVFFINSRSSFLGLILSTLVFLAYALYQYFKDKNVKETLTRFSLVIVPLLISFFIAQTVLNNATKLESEPTVYGSVTDRLASITIATGGGSNSLRMNQIKSAVSYIKEHPLFGAGYGNWKLASIPYERTFSDEMYITYHVHNDFLEIMAELGVIGGLLFISLFVCMLIFTLKTLKSKTSEQNKLASIFSLMALAAYFIDAALNFPNERPIMQIFLATIMAINVNSYINARKFTLTPENKAWSRPLFSGVTILLMIPAFYITQQTYRSMAAQNLYNADMLSGTPVYRAAQVLPSFPSIPNLNVFGFPIDAIKARYLLVDKKYDEALSLLNASANVNPYISYNEFLKANIFLEMKKMDSAYYYAQKCFFMKPRAKSNYGVLNVIIAQNKDSAMGTKAFREITKFRNEPWVWNEYINLMFTCGKDYKTLYLLADSAAKMFPNDADLKRKQQELFQFQNQPR